MRIGVIDSMRDPTAFPKIMDESDPRLRDLIDAVSDPSATIRSAAAWTLGKGAPGVASAIEALGRALDDPDPDVRRAAALALGGMGFSASSG